MAQWQVGRADSLRWCLLLFPVAAALVGCRGSAGRRGAGWACGPSPWPLHLLRCWGAGPVPTGAINGGAICWFWPPPAVAAPLIQLRAMASSCSSAARLATGLGLSRYDWIALLDQCCERRAAAGAATKPPWCWPPRRKASAPAAGSALESPGLALTPLERGRHAHFLTVGSHRWLLLPVASLFLASQTAAGVGGRSRLPIALDGLERHLAGGSSPAA